MVRLKSKLKEKSVIEKDSSAVFVVDKSDVDYAKVSRECPECGNDEAFHWVSTLSGEHAGIRRERTIEHFRCTRCSHSWSTSS